MGFLGFLAGPIGWLMKWIFDFVGDYFVTILLVTLVVRIVTFPFQLKSQKSTADRARLAPRLERIQKKYGQDKQKMAQKQQELYQKEGVSMTGGCLPSILQMIVLFSILAVIYSPLQYLTDIPQTGIDAAVSAVTEQKDKDNTNKLPASKFQGYYKELNLLQVAEKNKDDIINGMVESTKDKGESAITLAQANKYYETMIEVRDEFSIGSLSLLRNPWDDGFSLLWLIPLLSGLSAFAMSFLSTRYMKATMTAGQPGAGCSNGLMLYMMPIFSFVITFTVPGGVGLYWIFSNVIGIGQTVLLNKIYNPAEIRRKAEIEYEMKRRQRAEDKKRLAEQHAREQAEMDRARNEAAAKTGKKKSAPKKKAEPKVENTVVQELPQEIETVTEAEVPETETEPTEQE